MYKIYITYNSIRVERKPLFDAITYGWQKEKGQLFFNKTITNSFKFVNDAKNSIADYTFFKNIETGDACASVYIDVEHYCNGAWAIEAQGVFSVRDGSWDDDACTFTVTCTGLTNWNCLTKEITVNALQASPTVTTHFDEVGYAVTDFTRCRLLSDVIDYVAKGTCPDIVDVISDFFQINPNNPSAINYVTGTPNLYTECTISQKSDTFLPTPVNPATKAPLTWIGLMQELNSLFNVYWYIDSQNYVHIEHLSFFDTTAGGLNLTSSQYDDYVAATNKYTYDRSNMPTFEVFEQLLESGRGKTRIEYDNMCGAVMSDGSERQHKAPSFFTSYAEVFGTPEVYEGFVLWATRFNAGTGKYDHIWDEFYRGDGYNHVSPFVLPLRFFRHNNVQEVGKYRLTTQDTPFDLQDAFDIMFFTTAKNRKQVPLTIPLCCGDVFDPTKQVITSLGNGDVDSASFNAKSETLTLNLKYGEAPRVLLQPEDISGMDLWLKGDVGFTAGVSWLDQSGNNRDFDIVLGGGPTVGATLNGLNTVAFNGTQGLQSTLSWQPYPAKRGTVFIVVKHNTDLLNLEYIFGTHDSGAPNEFAMTREPVGNGFLYFISASFAWTSDSQDANNYRINVFQRETDNTLHYIGNGWESREDAQTLSDTSQPAVARWSLGFDSTLIIPNGLDGNIAEVIVYNRLLTFVERQNVETYLSRKWGIEAI